jgi:hypothetical protein
MVLVGALVAVELPAVELVVDATMMECSTALIAQA